MLSFLDLRIKSLKLSKPTWLPLSGSPICLQCLRMSGYLRPAAKNLPKNSPRASKPPGFAVLAELCKCILKLKVEYNMGAHLLRPLFFYSLFPLLLKNKP